VLAAYASHAAPDDPLSALVVGERPNPVVPAGWVPVTVRASSLNMHDLWTLRGVGIDIGAFPMILGSDAAGTLVDGTEVIVYPLVVDEGSIHDDWIQREHLLTEVHQGTLAETVVVPRENVVLKPLSMTWQDAACLGTAWLTAYGMIFVSARLRPGQSMLVQGATGGVASALIQLGRAAGMVVHVTARDDVRRDFATQIGAHDVHEPGAQLPARVDAVFETVGAATWAHSMRCVRPGGVIVCAGATTGGDVSAELTRIFFRRIRVIGAGMGTRRNLVELANFLDITGLRPKVGLELPLAQAREGLQAMEDGQTWGKVVLTH
jgi:NADPH:quinone reductase-like Zn-dependent oxidoreductase